MRLLDVPGSGAGPTGWPGRLWSARLEAPSWLFMAKCLTLTSTPVFCAARVHATAVREIRNGSSPNPSNVRPLSGVRMTLIVGANTTSLPLARTSSATVRP